MSSPKSSVWKTDDNFRAWIRELDAIISVEFKGLELGGIKVKLDGVLPWQWRELYDAGLSPQQAWERRKRK